MQTIPDIISDAMFILAIIITPGIASIIILELKRIRRSHENMVEEIRKLGRQPRHQVRVDPEVLRRLVYLKKKAEKKQPDKSRTVSTK